MATGQKPSIADALYHQPKGTAKEWIEYQQARVGLRKHDPKSDRDRGFVSPLGGTAKWPEPRKASVVQ